MSDAFVTIYRREGLTGLWRGVNGAVPRVMVGSAAQLATFASAKEWVSHSQVDMRNSWHFCYMCQWTFIATLLAKSWTLSWWPVSFLTVAQSKHLAYRSDSCHDQWSGGGHHHDTVWRNQYTSLQPAGGRVSQGEFRQPIKHVLAINNCTKDYCHYCQSWSHLHTNTKALRSNCSLSAFQGRLYHGFSDCMLKVCQAEGLLGFYKGMGPVFLRLAPHTVLSMLFWDLMRQQTVKNNQNHARS